MCRETVQNLTEAKEELSKLQLRVELLEALNKYDEILEAAGVSEVVVRGARIDFYKWENRFVERY